jgi:hypothetical protein
MIVFNAKTRRRKGHRGKTAVMLVYLSLADRDTLPFGDIGQTRNIPDHFPLRSLRLSVFALNTLITRAKILPLCHMLC